MSFRKSGFTLIELIMVTIIVAILSSIAATSFQDLQIKAKMSELYTTVGAIRTAETQFYMENGFYAAYSSPPCPAQYGLPYTYTQTCIDNFMTVLGLEVPGMDSTFVYGVYYDPATIYVRDRATQTQLCKYCLSTNTWYKYDTHPWAKYLNF